MRFYNDASLGITPELQVHVLNSDDTLFIIDTGHTTCRPRRVISSAYSLEGLHKRLRLLGTVFKHGAGSACPPQALVATTTRHRGYSCSTRGSSSLAASYQRALRKCSDSSTKRWPRSSRAWGRCRRTQPFVIDPQPCHSFATTA